MPLEQAIEYERDLQTICFATEDAKEGRTAFMEKRPPVFVGGDPSPRCCQYRRMMVSAGDRQAHRCWSAPLDQT